MMTNQTEKTKIPDERLQNILHSLSKCKIEYVTEREESKQMREINSKLEMELKESRELEKSHRYHLMNSREMIANLQETVSQLVYLKRNIKKLNDEMGTKDITINTMEKDKENLKQKHNETLSELRKAHENNLEEIKAESDRKVQLIQFDSDTQIAQFTCAIEELQSKLNETEENHRDKMNVLVLEYEEKIQRSAAQVMQLQEELARQAARTDANIDAYRRKLEEVEEKLKQSQFKEYLTQSKYPSQYENRVERPYSVNSEYSDAYSVDIHDTPIHDTTKTQFTHQNKIPKCTNTLQVMYGESKTPLAKNNDKKGHFNITKKRKLYNEKDFINC